MTYFYTFIFAYALNNDIITLLFQPLKEVARKKTDNVKFSTSPPRRPRGVSPLLGRKQKEQKKYHEVPVYHAEGKDYNTVVQFNCSETLPHLTFM